MTDGIILIAGAIFNSFLIGKCFHNIMKTRTNGLIFDDFSEKEKFKLFSIFTCSLLIIGVLLKYIFNHFHIDGIIDRFCISFVSFIPFAHYFLKKLMIYFSAKEKIRIDKENEIKQQNLITTELMSKISSDIFFSEKVF